MRKLHEAESAKEAVRILDGLTVDGIDAQVRPEGGTAIWVIEEGQMEAARASIKARADEDAAGLAKQASAVRAQATADAENHAQRFVDIGTRWRGSAGGRPGPVTLFLIVGSVAIFLLGLSASEDADPMWSLTIDHFASNEPLGRVQAGEWWRLWTPMFLHFGLFHLGFNMLWVWGLAPQIERNHGTTMLVVLVLCSELLGNLGQYFVSGPGFGGMSGVVYALFGFVWMSAKYNRRYRYALSETNTVLMILWFAACATGLFGPIANIGHAGGLVMGLAFGLPSYVRDRRARAPQADVKEGSWADLNRKGFARFRHRVVDRYAPLWLLLLAGIVIGAEFITKRTKRIDTGIASCDAYLRKLQRCAPPGLEYDVMDAYELWSESFEDNPVLLDEVCTELEATDVCAPESEAS